MAKQIRVRRDRPSALTWALALAVTMLAVYLITLSAPPAQREAETVSSERVTREIAFDGVTAHFAALGQYADAAQARIAAADLTGRGAAGSVYTDGDGCHVLGACYDNAADAERIARQIGEQESLETQVLTLEAGAVALRITAPADDVECIASADGTLRAQLRQIGSLALQVDRSEISPASARTLAAISRSELRAAGEALESVSGAAENPVCAGLLAQLENLAAALGEVARGDEAGAALSGRLRCCHVDGMLRLIDFLEKLKG